MTWKSWWLLFAVIWVVVAGLQVGLILGTSEEPEKAWQPAILGILVPAVAYAIGWIWSYFKKK